MGKKSKAKKSRKKKGGQTPKQPAKQPEKAATKAPIDVEVTVSRPLGGTATAGSSQPPPPSGPSAAGSGAGALYALLGVLAVGLAIAVYLVRLKLKVSFDPDYVSSCNLGGAINCDKVNISGWSELLGVPISLFAIPTYLVMVYFTWIALKARNAASSIDRDRGTVAIQSVAAIGTLTVGYSVFLAFVSSVWIQAYCLYCIGLYVVNIAATVLALRGGAGSIPASIGGALRALFSMRAPVPVAVLVLLVSAAVAAVGYTQAAESMETAYKRRIDEQLSSDARAPAGQAGEGSQASSAKAQGDEQKGETQVTTARSVKSQPAMELQASSRGTRGGDKTQDGYTYFEAPLSEDEFWAGNVDAEVTVVKYADFQCAYCRRLADSMEKVKKKYGDRTRFVMKHFPMNIKCNRAMRGFDKHPVACEAAYAAHCAGKQGKFWEMHDLLYDNQPSLSLEKLTELAEQLGLDMAAFDACMADPATHQVIEADVESGLYAGIYGTPRTYINSRLVTGSAHAAILEYYIDKALEEQAGRAQAASPVALAEKPDGRSMVAAEKEAGTFYIDPYEAAITKDGRAVSQPGLVPAQADYYTAKEACEKAGKRLCTEEEWVSACTGAAAIDENNNRMFADDRVEGDMYPYGAYHEEGVCQDRADEREGETVRTGSLEKCRTPSGIYDLAGNIAEWADAANGKPTLLGGNMSSATGAACNRRTFTTPPGSRNRTTGFRCCADSEVHGELVVEADIRPNVESVLDMQIPDFIVDDAQGNQIRSSDLKGNVTLINFFASWCGPCKKEFPHLVEYAEKFKDQGFRVVGVGVDTLPQRSLDFAEGFDVNFPVVPDPEARLKGKFIVYEMPATFLVDHDGVVRYRVTGFSGADQEAEMRGEIEKLLSASAQARG